MLSGVVRIAKRSSLRSRSIPTRVEGEFEVREEHGREGHGFSRAVQGEKPTGFSPCIAQPARLLGGAALVILGGAALSALRQDPPGQKGFSP